jgi:hypothetical protein
MVDGAQSHSSRQIVGCVDIALLQDLLGCWEDCQWRRLAGLLDDLHFLGLKSRSAHAALLRAREVDGEPAGLA